MGIGPRARTDPPSTERLLRLKPPCSSSGGRNVAARTGSGRNWGSRPEQCRGSCAGTTSPISPSWIRSLARRIRASKTTAVRYERDKPGELVHMDVKKLGRIPDGGGWRARGGTPRNHPRSPQDRHRLSVTTTSTRSSMTTHGSPTRKSFPTRKAPPAPHS